MKSFIFICIAVVSFLFFSTPTTRAGSVWYVNCDLSSNGNGSINIPWNNINSAKRSSGSVQPGDIVNIKGACLNVTFNTADSGTNVAQIVYQQWSGQINWTMYGTDSGNTPAINFTNAASYITINGAYIKDWYAGVYFGSSTGVTGVIIQNCEIWSCFSWGGIQTAAGFVNSFTIQNCKIHDNGDDPGGHEHNLYIESCEVGCSILNNEIYNGGTNNIQIYPDVSLGHTINITIAGNKIYHSGVADGSGNNIYLSSKNGQNGISSALVANNFIWEAAGSGIQIRNNNITYFKIFHNTLYNNSEYGIDVVSSSNSNLVEIKNNIAYGNKIGQLYIQPNNIVATNFVTNPQFISTDPLSSDFLKLSTNSPAIDAGVTISSITTDFFGTSRPQGTGYDIGAYEYPSGGSGDITSPSAPTGVQVI